MKKVLFMIVALLISATAVNAQGKGKGAGKGKAKNAALSVEDLAHKRADKMVAKFAFPQELKEKIYTLKFDRITAIRAAKATQPVDKSAVKLANEKYKAGLQSVLTAEQFGQVKKAWEAAKAKKKDSKNAAKANEEDELED
jgi:hypothetical protein